VSCLKTDAGISSVKSMLGDLGYVGVSGRQSTMLTRPSEPDYAELGTGTGEETPEPRLRSTAGGVGKLLSIEEEIAVGDLWNSLGSVEMGKIPSGVCAKRMDTEKGKTTKRRLQGATTRHQEPSSRYVRESPNNSSSATALGRAACAEKWQGYVRGWEHTV
jgi:hypothetical protein